MAEPITLDQALEAIRSEQIKTREIGFANLKHVLKVNQKAPELKKWKDKTCLGLFDVLFGVCVKERATYLRATKSNLKILASNRLSTAAGAFRFAVQVTVLRFESKTLKAVIDHITQALPVSDGSFCEPITSDYLKALVIILTHQPHVEHLAHVEWCSIIDLCLGGIATKPGEVTPSDAVFVSFATSRQSSSSNGHNPSVRLQASQSRVQRPANWTSWVEILFRCVKNLVSAPNCPLHDRSSQVVDSTLHYLRSGDATKSGAADAFATLNNILPRIMQESTSLTMILLKGCLPIIKSLWSGNEAALRDEMILTLLLGEAHISSILNADETGDALAEIIGILEVISERYYHHEPRTRRRLVPGDFCLSLIQRPPLDVNPFQARTFYLRSSEADAEYSWILIHVMTLFVSLVDIHSQRVGHNADVQHNTPSRKRLKKASQCDELIGLVTHNPISEKAYPMHVLAFLVNERTCELQLVEKLMALFLENASSADKQISSWAMLGLTGCIAQKCFDDVLRPDSWIFMWNQVLRLVTSSNHSRLACHVLNVLLHTGRIEYSHVSNSMESFVGAAGLNGPSSISDSAIDLWISIFEQLASRKPALYLLECRDHLLAWTLNKWKPNNFENKTYASQFLHEVSSKDAFRALTLSAIGSIDSTVTQIFANVGKFGSAWLGILEAQELVKYLLLHNDNHVISQYSRDEDKTTLDYGQRSRCTPNRKEGPLLDFYLSESELVLESWKAVVSERPAFVNADIVELVLGFCMVGGLLFDAARSSPGRRGVLGDKLLTICTAVMDFAHSQSTDLAILQQVFQTLSQFLPSYTPQSSKIANGIRSFHADVANSLSSAKNSRRTLAESHVSIDPFGFGEIDDEDESQVTQIVTQVRDELLNTNMSATCNTTSFNTSVATYFEMISCHAAARQSQSTTYASETFVDYMTSLTPAELLFSQPALNAMGFSSLPIKPSSAQKIIEYAGVCFLGNYDFERCEVSLCFCLYSMRIFAPLWIDDQHVTLADMGAQLYEHIINKTLENGIPSANVQIAVCALLFTLLKVNAEYRVINSQESVRTTLFGLLRTCELPVKYYIADKLPAIFSMFVLSQHSQIFNDVHDSLPMHVEWIEGISVRLLVLARMASQWGTLLRQCLYHIFETAGLVTESAKHATYCISSITKSLPIKDSQELFRIFSPQLLYTWLETQTLQSIPYNIFGYDSIKILLSDVEGEVVSQLIMRGSLEQLAELESLSYSPVKSLATRHFGQVVAYGISQDSCTVTSEGVQSHLAETLICRNVGESQYGVLINHSLPAIVGHLFNRLEQEDQIEKVLSKRKEYAEALRILKVASPKAQDEESLQLCQQPCFRTKYLLDILERLCRRSKKDKKRIWTPYLVTIVLRMILNDIHPALGSPHARRVLHRLRILCCLAGETMLRGYPLQQSIHALRTLLTDKYCSQEATDLFRYLIENGKKQLSQHLGFVAGTCASIMLDLRTFLKSTQDSTTQESQYRAVLKNADVFRRWLGEYFVSFAVGSQPLNACAETFEHLAQVSSLVSSRGNSYKESSESQLLLLFLQDLKNEDRLLSENFLKICFRSFCKDFTAPAQFGDDLLGEDKLAACFATEIWQTCRYSNLDSNYSVWAAKTLGRAFSDKGIIPRAISAETSLYHTIRNVDASKRFSTSRTAMLKTLSNYLESDEPRESGLAESTLSNIIYALNKPEEINLIEDSLSGPVIIALSPESRAKISLSSPTKKSVSPLSKCFDGINLTDPSIWIRNATSSIIENTDAEPLLTAMLPAIQGLHGLAEELFPYVIHIALLKHIEIGSDMVKILSDAFNDVFEKTESHSRHQIKYLLEAVLYLRTQVHPRESTEFDRNLWLDISHTKASFAARESGLTKMALLMIEIQQTTTARASRRSSVQQATITDNFLLSLFTELEEPDSFYGVQQNPKLEAIADRLSYENQGTEELLLRNALADSSLRSGSIDQAKLLDQMMGSMTRLNLNSLIQQVAPKQGLAESSKAVTDSMMHAALKLRDWNITIEPTVPSNISALYNSAQSVHGAIDINSAKTCIESNIMDIFDRMKTFASTGQGLRSSFAALAALTEADEWLSCQNIDDFESVITKMSGRLIWMKTNRLEDATAMLTIRESILGTINNNQILKAMLHIDSAQTLSMEFQAALQSSVVYRAHGSFQNSLTSVTYLSNLVSPCEAAGVRVNASVKYETAHVLWDRGELKASIQILQELGQRGDLDKERFPVGKADIFAKLGQQMSEARLDKADNILKSYLSQAHKDLKSRKLETGPEAGRVFHVFAAYCHEQLKNPDLVEELNRSQRFKERKEAEIHELEHVMRSKVSNEQKARAKSERSKAKKWLEIDKPELERLQTNKEQFLRQSLQNYMLGLAASDDHDTDVVRFLALWLEHASNDTANGAVAAHIKQVPTRKFASLMNQLASRLQDSKDDFQRVMTNLVERICHDHPYHGMYHVYAGSKTDGGNDGIARSRNTAAIKLAARLQSTTKTSKIWTSLHQANELFTKLASLKLEDKKTGQKIALRSNAASKVVETHIPKMNIPPITMSITLKEDLNYSSVPTIKSFKPEMTIAGGLSAPKILTAIASDGVHFKQLYKAGNDDLRQDAIMEQVFEQVSELLQSNKATKQRDLRIRTYKVIPLNANAGVIEFVQNTTPLNDYLRPAHSKYNPKDLKWEACRVKIFNAQIGRSDQRVKVYQDVAERFTPVLRHFFFEHYVDPDDWFDRRLAYTRSTAAISILGHVLGLGDRHCQNILLDVSTGEVVHIDLGVAFEAGRVLTIPEMVPFRLTRDLVDGFGIMGTEGVFRRCCEFTLEALRNNKDTIMTLLSVLRYDPLYSWSVSPLRAKRMQEQQDREMLEAASGTPAAPSAAARPTRNSLSGEAVIGQKEKHDDNEGGEADRALSVVEKKLATGLSVTATVNELIQQATDERNLALLFCGWAAYA